MTPSTATRARGRVTTGRATIGYRLVTTIAPTSLTRGSARWDAR